MAPAGWHPPEPKHHHLSERQLMMSAQHTTRGAIGNSADGVVVPFPRTIGEQVTKTLRELRVERGWSLNAVVGAMRACATPEERKGLPDPDSIKRSWRRWEAGTVVPDGNLGTKPFYRPIIARMFGIDPDEMFPPVRAAAPSHILSNAVDLLTGLESRRDQVRHEISRLQGELAYLDAVLAVPLPAAR